MFVIDKIIKKTILLVVKTVKKEKFKCPVGATMSIFCYHVFSKQKPAVFEFIVRKGVIKYFYFHFPFSFYEIVSVDVNDKIKLIY